MMAASRSKAKARETLEHVGENLRDRTATTGALVGIGYALLELAWQVGRVADQVPVYGPQEER